MWARPAGTLPCAARRGSEAQPSRLLEESPPELMGTSPGYGPGLKLGTADMSAPGHVRQCLGPNHTPAGNITAASGSGAREGGQACPPSCERRSRLGRKEFTTVTRVPRGTRKPMARRGHPAEVAWPAGGRVFAHPPAAGGKLNGPSVAFASTQRTRQWQRHLQRETGRLNYLLLKRTA